MKKIIGLILGLSLMVFPLAAQWSKTYRSSDGSNFDRANAVKTTSDGGFIVVGYAYPSDGGDMWVLKLNAAGDVVRQKRYSGSDGDQGMFLTSIVVWEYSFFMKVAWEAERTFR